MKRLKAWLAALVLGAAAAGSAAADNALPAVFDDIERRTFDFFWETGRADNGLVPDRFPYDEPFSSIAAVGFALTAYPVGAERGWITREQARDRTLATLRFFERMPNEHGFFWHFVHLETGERYDHWVEASSVDSALLLMGMLFAQSWFDGDDAKEREIRELAETIYQRVDWTWLQQRGELISMGWTPEKGFIDYDWRGYNEAMIVYLLALASPTHAVQPSAWQAWTNTYDDSWGEFAGYEHLGFGPMFGHQYSHVWVDFRGIQDAYMRGKGIDYFENSRRATLSQRAYAIENPNGFTGYGANEWGLTACDGPGGYHQLYNDGMRSFRGYSARGAGRRDAFDDGTLAPTALGGSLPFAPEIVVPAIEHLHAVHGEHIYGRYGFYDSFNRSFVYDIDTKPGRVIPGFGWVAHQWLGIDQGPILLMAQNHRNGRVWDVMKRNPHVRRGLERAGFTGGWLDAPAPE